MVLTFDDGLIDHYRYVLPLLVDRGLFGIFYVCTAPLERPKLLDVHRVHLLLGRIGGQAAYRRLMEFLDSSLLSDPDVADFCNTTYGTQDNDGATTAFKRTLNYLVSYDYREYVLDHLFAEEFGDDGAAEDFYLAPAQIREMDRLGMIIGSHGVNHNVFSRLPLEDQRQEISGSLELLGQILGKKVTTFCYPYGGLNTFTRETTLLLEQEGCRYAFAVDPREVTAMDLAENRQALPRYDCNMFPHGRASFGRQRAEQAA